jgi:voltage-gated potassium channel
MQARPLVTLLALAAASSPDLARDMLNQVETGIRDGYAHDPMEATVGTVLISSYLFYLAERDHNPKVNSYYDALIYVSTNLSVGYSDIFARTPAGKALGSLLMTYGPAMADKIFQPPAKDGPVVSDDTHAIVERLDRILEALAERQRDAPT